MSKPKKSKGPKLRGSKWSLVWWSLLSNGDPVGEDSSMGWMEFECDSVTEARNLQSSLHQRSRRVEEVTWRVETRIEEGNEETIYFRRVWIQTPDHTEA